MPLARTNRRGSRLNSRLFVKGIQWRSRFSSVMSMSVSAQATASAGAGLWVMILSAESGPDLRRRRLQLRYELDGAHQRQPRGRSLHGDRSDDIPVPVAHRHRDAGNAEHVFLVVDRVTDVDDAVQLRLEHRAVGDGALREALQRHQPEQALALGYCQVSQQQFAAGAAVRGQSAAALGNVQAQWPRRFDAVEVYEGAFLEHREIAGLADLAHHTAQYRAALGCCTIAAQHIEGKARQAFTDDIGAAAGLAGEEARFLEQRERAVERGLWQLGRLHEL